jgi:ribosome-binding protein aMBF1 (putative translation factor)
MAQSCSHMKQIKFKSTETDVCEECIKLIEKQARNETLPSQQASAHPFH